MLIQNINLHLNYLVSGKIKVQYCHCYKVSYNPSFFVAMFLGFRALHSVMLPNHALKK